MFPTASASALKKAADKIRSAFTSISCSFAAASTSQKRFSPMPDTPIYRFGRARTASSFARYYAHLSIKVSATKTAYSTCVADPSAKSQVAMIRPVAKVEKIYINLVETSMKLSNQTRQMTRVRTSIIRCCCASSSPIHNGRRRRRSDCILVTSIDPCTLE